MQFDIDDWKEVCRPVSRLQYYLDTFFSKSDWYMPTPAFIHKELNTFISLHLGKIEKNELERLQKFHYQLWEEKIQIVI
jgi:hypothetical protein